MQPSPATLSLQLLVGLAIEAAFIDDKQETIILKTFDGDFYQITHHSDCCEYVYYGHVNLSEHLIGAIIFKVDELGYQDLDTSEVTPRNPKTESFCKLGISIHTEDGTVTLETRMEGNGQYAGDLTVSKIVITETFRIEENEGNLKTLYTPSDKMITYPAMYCKLQDF